MAVHFLRGFDTSTLQRTINDCIDKSGETKSVLNTRPQDDDTGAANNIPRITCTHKDQSILAFPEF